jgi:hypothetical protein
MIVRVLAWTMSLTSRAKQRDEPTPRPQPRQRRYSVGHQARLDAEMHTTLKVLAGGHQKRGQVLRHIIQWGLARTEEWTVDRSIPDRCHLVHMLLDRALLQQAQDGADARGLTVAAWLRHAMRQLTLETFPASWCAREMSLRSHDYGY